MTTADAMERQAGSRWRSFAAFATFAGIFLVVFVANLGYSLREGRLSTVPVYDDGGYMADAYKRLVFSTGDGLSTAISSFYGNPPHAPVSALTAMFGYWAFGSADIAVYIANGWVLALYILVMALISRPLADLPTRALFVAVAAYVPAAHAMVNEFRPDLAAGLFFALAIGAICRFNLRTATLRQGAAVVGLVVLATITKPSALVLTVPALLIALGMSILFQGFLTSRDRWSLVRNALAGVGLYLVIFAPFALVWGKPTILYIHEVLFAKSDIWKTEGDRLFHATFHLFGPGGARALGIFAVAGLLILLVDLAAWWRRPDYRRPGVPAYLATLVVVYAAMSLSREKTVYQGSLFYLPFILGVAAAAVRLLSLAGVHTRRIAMAVPLALAVLFLPLTGGFAARSPYAEEAKPILARVHERLLTLARDEWSSPTCRGQIMKITTTNYEPLIPDAIELDMAKSGIHTGLEYIFYPRSLDEALASVDRMDVLLIQDASLPPVNTWMPISAYIPQITEHLEQKPGIRKFQVGSCMGRPYWLYVLRQCS